MEELKRGVLRLGQGMDGACGRFGRFWRECKQYFWKKGVSEKIPSLICAQMMVSEAKDTIMKKL